MSADLYGFPLPSTFSPLEVTTRAACDETDDQQAHAWAPFVEQDKLPAEARLKELVRKVRTKQNSFENAEVSEDDHF
jgi:hypothetical protein